MLLNHEFIQEWRENIICSCIPRPLRRGGNTCDTSHSQIRNGVCYDTRGWDKQGCNTHDYRKVK